MTMTLEQPAEKTNGNGSGDNVPVKAQAQRREIRAVEDNGPLAYLLDTARYEHTQRIASGMARASLIPDHLRGLNFEETLANCFLVVNQSLRWGFDPFAVAPETYAIGGKLAYQGKLIAAVINARSNIKGGLKYLFNAATGDDFALVVYASTLGIPDEAMPLLTALADRNDKTAIPELQKLDVMAVRLSVGKHKTNNSMWTKDPEQKLIYSGAIRWARRHRPEVVLGVLTEDDAERMEASKVEALAQRPRGLKGLEAKVTNRPVSEGQTLEPTPEALEAARLSEEEALRILAEKSPSVQQQPPQQEAADTLPSDNQSTEDGTEGQQGPAPATPAECATAESFMDCINAAGVEHFETPEKLTRWLEGKLMRIQKKGKLDKTTVAWRVTTLNDLRAGKLD